MSYLVLTIFLLHLPGASLSPKPQESKLLHGERKEREGRELSTRALVHDFFIQRKSVSVPKKLCAACECHSTKLLKYYFVSHSLVHPHICPVRGVFCSHFLDEVPRYQVGITYPGASTRIIYHMSSKTVGEVPFTLQCFLLPWSS